MEGPLPVGTPESDAPRTSADLSRVGGDIELTVKGLRNAPVGPDQIGDPTSEAQEWPTDLVGSSDRAFGIADEGEGKAEALAKPIACFLIVPGNPDDFEFGFS